MSGVAENARMLAALLGVDEDEAAERLQRRVLVTAAAGLATAWAREIAGLLERTVMLTDDPAAADVELVVGGASPRSAAPSVYAAIDAELAIISRTPVAGLSGATPHPLFAMVCACGATAAVLNAAVKDARLPPTPDPLQVRLADLGLPDVRGLPPIDLTGGVLVGAGAVAHGFLKALRHLPVQGRLDVLDPKTVGASNPNRCLYLTHADVGDPKAEALVEHAAGDFLHLELLPEVGEFKDYAAARAKVPLAIVTVDSRRARRQIQKFVPGRVLDASTTDVRGVVVHSHVQPTPGACLACIYQHVPDEAARERSIAEGLGISLAEVKQGFIDAAVAEKICRTHPGLNPQTLVGKAFDTLFRELCGAQALRTLKGGRYLRPSPSCPL
jgi:molybdopterin/thiamine biosynthesis adenylyltransferase